MERTRELYPGAWVHEEADRVLKPVPLPPADGRLQYSEDHLPTVDADRPVDAFTAIQLGLWDMLSAMRPRSFDLVRWLQDGEVRSRVLKFQRVFLDWPRAEDDAVPTPSVCIQQADEGAYDQTATSPDNRLQEETLNRYGDGTVLKSVAFLRAPVQLVAMLATKDDRAGVRKAFEDAFLAEPSDDRPGRRVVVRAYHDQVVRYQLIAQAYNDDAEAAQANQWILTARLEAEVPVVMLVRAPASMRPNLGATVLGADGR